MKIKKLHQDAVIPKYATAGAAGFDLCARLDKEVYVALGQCVKVGTGLAVSIPEGHVMVVAPRSGLGSNSGIVLGNLIGVIDSDYRGEITLAIWNRSREGQTFKISSGDRIAQAMVMPVQQVTFQEVDELDQTTRGAGGFGSTGTV